MSPAALALIWMFGVPLSILISSAIASLTSERDGGQYE